jgi:hypothetical protein
MIYSLGDDGITYIEFCSVLFCSILLVNYGVPCYFLCMVFCWGFYFFGNLRGF